MFNNKEVLKELNDINRKLSVVVSLIKSEKLKSTKGDDKNVQ